MDLVKSESDMTVMARVLIHPTQPSFRVLKTKPLHNYESWPIPGAQIHIDESVSYNLDQYMVTQKISERDLVDAPVGVPSLVAMRIIRSFEEMLSEKIADADLVSEIAQPLTMEVARGIFLKHCMNRLWIRPDPVIPSNPATVGTFANHDDELFRQQILCLPPPQREDAADPRYPVWFSRPYRPIWSTAERFPHYREIDFGPLGEVGLDRLTLYTVPAASPERIKAEANGDALLKDVLGESDYDHFKKSGYVDLPSTKDPNVGYRIRDAGRMIGLLKRENGSWVEDHKALCVQAKDSYKYVPGDQTSSQVLLCKYDEGLLWNTANLHQFKAA